MKDPFKIFFPLGWLMGLVFLVVWPLWGLLGWISYPGAFHVQGIISLFIGSFAIGFLTTALPRFTDTAYASKKAVFLFLILSITEFFVLIFGNLTFSNLIVGLKFLGIILFARPRFLKRKNPIPPSFVWVAFGILMAVIGGIGSYFISHPVFETFVRRGFLTALYLGIGGKLIPFLTGVKAELNLTEDRKINEFQIHFVLAVLFVGSMIGEGVFASHLQPVFLGIQALVLFVEIAFIWKLTTFPKRMARPWLLWLSTWCLPVSLFSAAFFPVFKIHSFHIMFVGTFLLGTTAIASHVIVTHQNLSQNLLYKFRPLGLTGAIILLATFTRAFALMANYPRHLAYAGILALAALLYWGKSFIRAAIK